MLDKVNYATSSAGIILDNYNIYKYQAEAAWPFFYTAYVDGGISITCDKELYGEQPGNDLSEHFTVSSRAKCLPVGVENSVLEYEFIDTLPTNMAEYFVDEAWLQESYNLTFADFPSERYDVLTLRVTIPMTREHVYDYAVDQFEGEESPGRYFSKAVYTAECSIKFNREGKNSLSRILFSLFSSCVFILFRAQEDCCYVPPTS